jgi:CubicO group peptidase (beta-lactamase class C family)
LRYAHLDCFVAALLAMTDGPLPSLRAKRSNPETAAAGEKLWAPLGAEAAASWIIDATGQDVTFAYVNAVLRDWARLGLMLAHHGTWSRPLDRAPGTG